MQQALTHQGDLRLGEWTLRADWCSLQRGSQEQVLNPKEMAVLQLLAERAPAVVSTEELLSRVWPDVVVGDNAVQQVIRRLRRMLRDDARHPHYIETLPKRGYRLLVVPQPAAERGESAPRSYRGAVLVLGAVAAVAVLVLVVPDLFDAPDEQHDAGPVHTQVAIRPFRDLTPGGDLDWLAHGLTFELSHQIAQMGAFGVLPPSLVGDAGPGELPTGADLLLEGHVQQGEAGVVVGVQAIHVRSGRQLWAETFVGTREDPYALQVHMAARLSRYFRDSEMAWTPSSPTVLSGPQKPEARAAYLKLLHYQWGGHPQEILDWAERTVQIDPSWSAGHLHLAGEYLSRINGPDGALWANKARASLAAARSGGLDNDPYFLLTEGSQLWRLDGDLSGAEQRLRAAAMDPSEGYRIEYAHFMVASGLAAEAEPVIADLTRIAPRVPVFWYHLAIARAINGDYGRALQAARRWGDLTEPQGYSILQYPLLLLTARVGSKEGARGHLTRLDRLAREGGTGSDLAAALGTMMRFELAMRDHDTAAASALADSLIQKPSVYPMVGTWLLRLNDPRAEQHLTEALDHSDRGFLSLILMSIPAQHRTHPLFQGYLDGLGHTREWRQELCGRAATLPPDLGFRCDPERYQPPASAELSRSDTSSTLHSSVLLHRGNGPVTGRRNRPDRPARTAL